MEQNEYLTIKDFAEIAGVSKQAVYQRLTGTLKPYVSIRNGVKYVNIKALELYKEDDTVKNLKKNNQVQSDNSQVDSMIELLKNELEAKNRQIDKLHKLLEQSNANLAQVQYRLQLIEESRNQESEDKEPEEVAVVAEKEPEQKKSWWRKWFM